jgi:hypothetical protein
MDLNFKNIRMETHLICRKMIFRKWHVLCYKMKKSSLIKMSFLAATETQTVPGDVTNRDRSRTVSVSTLSNLSIYFQNVNRVRQKTNELYFSVCSSDFDIIILLETNFNDDFFNEELFDSR